MPRARKILASKKAFYGLMEESLAIIQRKKKFSEAQGDIFLLLGLARDSFKGNYRGLSKKNLTLIVAGLVYLINPMDLVPDFVFGLGYGDDLAVLSYILSKLTGEIGKYRSWKNQVG